MMGEGEWASAGLCTRVRCVCVYVCVLKCMSGQAITRDSTKSRGVLITCATLNGHSLINVVSTVPVPAPQFKRYSAGKSI